MATVESLVRSILAPEVFTRLLQVHSDCSVADVAVRRATFVCVFRYRCISIDCVYVVSFLCSHNP